MLVKTEFTGQLTCVPNLQFNGLSFELNSADFLQIFILINSLDILKETHKINTDCRDVRLRVCVVCKTQKQARLSNPRVSNQQELEQVIAEITVFIFNSSIKLLNNGKINILFRIDSGHREQMYKSVKRTLDRNT